MATRYVWNSSAQDDSDSTWNSSTLAYLTIKGAVDASSAGDDIYVHTGATSTHTETISAADENWDGSTTAATGIIQIIGVDKNNSDAYTISASANVTLSSTYDLNIDGAFAIYGIEFANTGTGFIYSQSDSNEGLHVQDCTFDASSATAASFFQTTATNTLFKDCTFDRGSDDGRLFLNSGQMTFIGCTFIGTHASSAMIQLPGTAKFTLIGCDFSQLSTTDLLSSSTGITEIIGCRLHANTSVSASAVSMHSTSMYESDDDTGNSIQRTEHVFPGSTSCTVSTAEYRTGGGTYDGSNEYSYVISLYDADVKHLPAYTPWSTGYLSTTGSKTWTAYITNSGVSDLDDTEVWLEVEYFGASGNTLKTIADDKNSDPTVAVGSGTDQTDDTGSTWQTHNTYKQKLEVTATVNRAGSFRWRVGSRVATDIYICPAIEIT